MLKDLLRKNRSYRRFDHNRAITLKEIQELVGLTTLCASARNIQPLKYILFNDAASCSRVFPALAWAGYLEWPGPDENERPTGYILQFLDTRIASNCMCDDGIHAQTILLGAVEKGMGGCIIKAVNESLLRVEFAIPEYLKLIQVIALGYPVEKVYLEPMKDNQYKYWRDENGGHHVPKRGVEEIIIGYKKEEE